MLTKETIVAGLTFTVEPTESYVNANLAKGVEVETAYTFRVKHKDAHEKDGRQYEEAWFISLHDGEQYNYLAMLNPETGLATLTRASCRGEQDQAVLILRRILAAIWAGKGQAIEAAGWKLFKGKPKPKPVTVPAEVEDDVPF